MLWTRLARVIVIPGINRRGERLTYGRLGWTVVRGNDSGKGGDNEGDVDGLHWETANVIDDTGEGYCQRRIQVLSRREAYLCVGGLSHGGRV